MQIKTYIKYVSLPHPTPKPVPTVPHEGKPIVHITMQQAAVPVLKAGMKILGTQWGRCWEKQTP